MGLLSQGQPLDYEEIQKYKKKIKDQGVRQFIKLFNASKNRADGQFKWGDEIEYILIRYNHTNKDVYMNLKAERVFDKLDNQARLLGKNRTPNSEWHPEYGAYMVESTPRIPYDCDPSLLSGLCLAESNMRARRSQLIKLLEPNESIVSITNFPRHGCPNASYPWYDFNPSASCLKSLFLPEQVIYSGHPRFKVIASNIKKRRQSKVEINVPVFFDTNTERPFINIKPSNSTSSTQISNQILDSDSKNAAKPNHVYMDATSFGMGCCCLQITLQATHIKEAQILYDQLLPLTPILTALSAGSPAYRGYLTERDCRWNVISDACDDRTFKERGNPNRNHDQLRHNSNNQVASSSTTTTATTTTTTSSSSSSSISTSSASSTSLSQSPSESLNINSNEVKKSLLISKSRYGTVSSYLSCRGQEYNDIPLCYNENYYKLMLANGIQEPLAKHIAHLFIRDPIAVYREKIDQADDETDHFENIQSTNWQTLRFKPPPNVSSPIGWRVEFRPIEVQTTDFENAAYSVFVILLTRVLLAYKLNLLLPISIVDLNMEEAQKRDAVTKGKFWFRSNMTNKSNARPLCSRANNNTSQQGTTCPHCYCPSRSATINSNNDIISSDGSNNNYINNNHSETSDQDDHLVMSRPALEREPLDKYARLMSIDEIVNGSKQFVGLIPIVGHYVDSLADGTNGQQIEQIRAYLRLISGRANGKIKTTARFIRDFVRSHPNYKFDSYISEAINYDLIHYLDQLSRGQLHSPELLGNNLI